MRLDARQDEVNARLILRGDTPQHSQALQQVVSSVCTTHFTHFHWLWRLIHAQGARESCPELDNSQAEPSYDSQTEAVAALEAKFDRAFESARELIILLSAACSKL